MTADFAVYESCVVTGISCFGRNLDPHPVIKEPARGELLTRQMITCHPSHARPAARSDMRYRHRNRTRSSHPPAVGPPRGIQGIPRRTDTRRGASPPPSAFRSAGS